MMSLQLGYGVQDRHNMLTQCQPFWASTQGTQCLKQLFKTNMGSLLINEHTVQQLLRNQNSFFHTGIQAISQRWHKCIAKQEAYIGKIGVLFFLY